MPAVLSAREQSDGKRCPNCKFEGKGQQGEHDTAIHQGEGKFLGIEAHIVAVERNSERLLADGRRVSCWKCWNCAYEWGFEQG